MTVTADIQSAEKKVGVFLTAHHVILYVVLFVALGFGIYAVQSRIASVAEAKAEAAQTALAVEKDHAAQLLAAYTLNEAQRDKERAEYLATIAQLQAQTKIQIIHDKSLPAPALGQRLEDLTGFKRGTVTVNQNDDLIVPLPLGQEIVARLDQALADAQTVTKQDGVIKSQQATIADQQGIIAEDKNVLAKQIEADKKELTAVKAQARKSKIKWFAAGAVFGFVGRQFVHFGL